ncbi:MAG TPA: hypothetical protein VJ692_07395 [Nitrospiraceae bacterium]|nr:hypothetical protein [Nitrospiraceae bacterium]
MSYHERDFKEAYVKLKERVQDALDRWSDDNHMQLHGGEMTAQERRTVKAVLRAIRSDLWHS